MNGGRRAKSGIERGGKRVTEAEREGTRRSEKCKKNEKKKKTDNKI